MGRFDEYKRQYKGEERNGVTPVVNPMVFCEIQEPVERMTAAREALDDKAHAFLKRFSQDVMFDGILDVDEEWRCWLERDAESSCLFFDDTLEVFENDAYDYFVDHYSAEWKEIAREDAAIDKMGQSLNEYKIFKTALYNVFNNYNRLSVREYYDQISARAPDYGMYLEGHSKDDFDFIVTFKPLDEVNRGNPYFEYELYLAYNPDHGKDGYVYSVLSMNAHSADSMYVGPVDLPIYGRYEKFEKVVNDWFLSETHSLFYYDALKAQRVAEKEKYNIPADYFEGTYIDTKKLIDVSEKSYRYGDSNVYIPKSQIAFAGDKLYMKRWLFYKLRDEIGAQQKEKQNTVDGLLADAADKAGVADKNGVSKKETDLGK